MNDAADPVRAQRARIARGVSLAKRIGYGLLGGAVILFVVAATTGFPDTLTTATLIALIGACVVLPIPIVLGYGIRAAEREDRAREIAADPASPAGEERENDER